MGRSPASGLARLSELKGGGEGGFTDKLYMFLFAEDGAEASSSERTVDVSATQITVVQVTSDSFSRRGGVAVETCLMMITAHII